MPIRNLSRFAQAAENYNGWQSFWHKTSAPPATVGSWLDLSMGAGLPKYNAYVGSQATATPLIGSGNDGIYLGPLPPAGQDRYINRIMVQAVQNTFAPAPILFCDYLMHYPLIDGDSTVLQVMDNTATLPRYSNGEGVQCMLVTTTPVSSNAIITVNYTNSGGVSGRISESRTLASAFVGTLLTGAAVPDLGGGRRTPFIPLADGDKGIRSIESIQLATPGGGFFAAVLVKPLTQVQCLETAVASEINMVPQRAATPVKLQSGAYINMLALVSNSTGISAFRGTIETVWQ